MASRLNRSRQLRTPQTWIAISLLAPVGILILSAIMLFSLRQDAWDKAAQISQNLLQVIERDITRNVELYDLSLKAAVENLETPGLAQLSPQVRQTILFDRAATARDMGVMLIIDASGNVVEDMGMIPPRTGNYADRDYFLAHKARADLGLFIGSPLVSRITAERMLPFSRRITRADGSFGGIALGTLKLSYFSKLFDQLVLGQDGAINFYHRDGTRIMRYPYVEADLGVNIKGAPTFVKFLDVKRGSFIGTSVRDGVERSYAFTQVGDLPLILNVALSVDDIEAEWRMKALVIGSAVLTLCGLTIALTFLFGRELKRRAAMQIELLRLSLTDTLTGLPNRRRFDEALRSACADAVRNQTAVSLLIIDADHFKRFNDRYGHAVGDEVLKSLARHLGASVHRPGDLVCRIGGEEFGILLPETDGAGALRIADKVHAEVTKLALPKAGLGAGAVTVSIGSVSALGGQTLLDPIDLYRSADGALYEAKAGGRNQTRSAPPPLQRGSTRASMIRLARTA